MKRDMDLVRSILLTIEAEPSGFAPRKMTIEDFSDEQIGYHIYIMMEAGLIKGADITNKDSKSPEAIPINMTWQGHEFLEASRDSTRWEKAKGIAAKMGGVTINMLITILTSLMTEQAKQLLP